MAMAQKVLKTPMGNLELKNPLAAQQAAIKKAVNKATHSLPRKMHN
jgi:hypothetical protein